MPSIPKKNLKSRKTFEVHSNLVLFFLFSWSLLFGGFLLVRPYSSAPGLTKPWGKRIGEHLLLSAYAIGYLLYLSHPLGALWVNRADEHEKLDRTGKTFLHGLHHFHYCCTALILGNCHRGYIHCLLNRIFFCFFILVVFTPTGGLSLLFLLQR